MKKMYKIATVLLAFCFLLGSVPMSVKAEDYTYKVTIYSGKQGTFTGIPGNLVKEIMLQFLLVMIRVLL